MFGDKEGFKETLISVIVPVYNVERYLRRCIESVLNQTYKEIELILIDDGSTDTSPMICDEYVGKEKNVKVIHKINGGVASARNIGINNASGKYICFLDSDDILPSDSVELLYNAIKEKKAEYVAGICSINESKKVKNPINEEKIIDLEKDSRSLLEYITNSGSYSPYAKMYSSDIIKNNNLYFAENLKCSEDALFIRDYMRYCTRIAIIPEIVYYYNTFNESSLSKKGYEEFCEYFVEKLKSLEKLCDRLSIEESEKKKFITWRAIHGLNISTNHYLKNWKDGDEQKKLIIKSAKLMKPYITIGNENLEQMSNGLKKWWIGIRKLYVNCAYENMVMFIKRKYNKSSRYSMVKRLIKGIFHI